MRSMDVHHPAVTTLRTTFSRNMIAFASQCSILTLLTWEGPITSYPWVSNDPSAKTSRWPVDGDILHAEHS